MDSKENLDTVALLQEQIKTLQQVIEAKDQLIQVLRQAQPFHNHIHPVQLQPIYGPCQHQYPPGMWGGTVPPSCMKCGQPAYNPLVITCDLTV
jgi:hypothetical protein